jgi:hypothetical protein
MEGVGRSVETRPRRGGKPGREANPSARAVVALGQLACKGLERVPTALCSEEA